ncbi:hypothetical protein [Oceaniglobus trochenteri]|uniref:hypothetical protein n=1 Tax=Oceaniglobus trochenteri TaxID=2763260 RepID=UPI001CFFFBCA|nr:hypothetical protein [Oceaniglobus trochenteri]
MAALVKGRVTPEALGEDREGKVAASQVIFTGALVCRNAAGYLVKGVVATGLVGVGCAVDDFDNGSGANGAINAKYRPGVFRFANSGGADEITFAQTGDVCFVVDDQTVAKTDGSSARSPAGIVDHVDDIGVWVRFDEALTLAATA